VNMDYGNTIYFHNVPSPADTVKLYGDKLFYMHLKNSVGMGGERHPVALWDGEINHRTYMQAVLASGFKGPIGIEAPRGGDREWFARQDLDYFKALADEIGMA
ncbi:MAG: TIM barrel protein, partial [Clostridia bacterium]